MKDEKDNGVSDAVNEWLGVKPKNEEKKDKDISIVGDSYTKGGDGYTYISTSACTVPLVLEGDGVGINVTTTNYEVSYIDNMESNINVGNTLYSPETFEPIKKIVVDVHLDDLDRVSNFKERLLNDFTKKLDDIIDNVK